MEITTQMIKELRAATSAPMLDCRKALQEADGDYQKAVDWLREKGMATAAKRADRDASNGVVELYSHGGGRVGVMVEINCETDFVARAEQFRHLAHEIALQIAASAPKYIKAEDIPAEELQHESEINRAPAKVQSALLEVMQEKQVTIGRETHKVPSPFLVLATQNPIETEGTYALPEAQVDRFMLKVLVGYPTATEEFVIVERMTSAFAEAQKIITTLSSTLAFQSQMQFPS